MHIDLNRKHFLGKNCSIVENYMAWFMLSIQEIATLRKCSTWKFKRQMKIYTCIVEIDVEHIYSWEKIIAKEFCWIRFKRI